MSKYGSKILTMIYGNSGEGASLDRICKALKISRTVASMELAYFLEKNVITEHPGELFKPSLDKLKW